MTDKLNYDTACLAVLSISQWTARVKDKAATKEAEERAGAKAGTATLYKSLLPFNEQLKKIHQKTTFIRTEFYRRTLPWGFEGVYLLPVSNFEFIEWFNKQKYEWWTLVRDLLDEYIQFLKSAESDLGTLYNADDYPSVAAVRDKFAIDISLMPVPDTDLRVTAANDKAAKIVEQQSAALEKRILANHKEAMKKVWSDLYEKLEHLHKKLDNASETFRDATVENIAEQVKIVSDMNFTNDPDLSAIRREVEAKLVLFADPHVWRTDLDLRRKKADETKQIMDKMSALMGN